MEKTMKMSLPEGMGFIGREELMRYLGGITVGVDETPPERYFSLLVPNPDYDPDGFSQEIEDSEVYRGRRAVVLFAAKGVDAFFMDSDYRNYIFSQSQNSAAWQRNHTKSCGLKMLWNAVLWPCVNEGGRRHFGSAELAGRILEKASEYGGLVGIS